MVMIGKSFKASMILLLVFVLSGTAAAVYAQDSSSDKKALCARMLQFGKEAYMRGKYLDAKEYFRKAVQADPSNQSAWRFYDQSVIFALAEKVEKDTRLILPDTSVRHEAPSSTPSPVPASPVIKEPPVQPAPPPPPSSAPPKKDPEFKIIQDEGC
jgi:hypothetical protein